MGMLVGNSDSQVRRIVLKNADGTHAGTITIRKSGKKKKKRLQYNFKEMSSRIMRTKTSMGAKQVAASASVKVGSLRKQLKSGDYDERELTRAILHAEAMERIAKKKMKHLQQEEKAKKNNKYETQEEEREKDGTETGSISEQMAMEQLQELQKLMREEMESAMQEAMEETIEEMKSAMKEMQSSGGLQELSDNLLEEEPTKKSPEELERYKKKHRSEEIRALIEADMKYLRAMFEKLEKEKRDLANGVALELYGMEVPVSDAQTEVPPLTEGSVDVLL